MRWLIAVLAALVLVLQYRIWLSPHGAREVMQLSAAVKQQAEENARLTARNQQLAAEVRNLKQGYEAIEERARSELGLIATNETYYQVVPAVQPAAVVPDTPVPATRDEEEAPAASLAAAR
jgi:cell division protein FtsB